MSHRPKCQCHACRSYRPTPAQIRRECERIRAAWSPREHATRIVDDDARRAALGEPMTVTLVNLDAVDRELWRE